MADEHTGTQPHPNLSTEPGRKELASNTRTQTQSDPNLSTEHQREGDARSPSDTLDRGQDTPGGQPPERVEDRPVVGTVKPEDYPKDGAAD
ncbi:MULTISPECIES: hypothetical protein [Sphingobium]|uniref:hypothetical protein n=1 Tax=Sphingobium sp. MI1205 TaxID=407020 RepID=UPI0007702B97|nr:hypothetical protein [Sphingobium sp. MI1205]AMK17375.1 hypothetical protein K663_04950 [Sphingobium sp. MI1205]